METGFDRVGLGTPERLAQWQAQQAEKKAAERNTFPTDSERRNSFMWTEKHDRPTENTAGVGAGQLASAQRIWDEAEQQRLQHVAAADALRSAREAREAERQERLDAKRQERIEADDQKLVGELRRRYMAADRTATEAQFLADLPEIRRQHRLDAALGRTPTPAITSLVDMSSF